PRPPAARQFLPGVCPRGGVPGEAGQGLAGGSPLPLSLDDLLALPGSPSALHPTSRVATLSTLGLGLPSWMRRHQVVPVDGLAILDADVPGRGSGALAVAVQARPVDMGLVGGVPDFQV